METQPTLPTPAPGSDPRPIAPRHLWHHLTADQQRHLLQTLVLVGQELVVRATSPQGREEAHE